MVQRVMTPQRALKPRAAEHHRKPRTKKGRERLKRHRCWRQASKYKTLSSSETHLVEYDTKKDRQSLQRKINIC